MNNLEKLKKIIQKAVPSILELKFGCEVEKKKGMGFTERIIGVWYDQGFAGQTIIATDMTLENRYESKQYKILGRPITLEDVLIALRDNKNCLEMRRAWSVIRLWQLGQSLDNQTPETHDFLLSVLK